MQLTDGTPSCPQLGTKESTRQPDDVAGVVVHGEPFVRLYHIVGPVQRVSADHNGHHDLSGSSDCGDRKRLELLVVDEPGPNVEAEQAIPQSGRGQRRRLPDHI